MPLTPDVPDTSLSGDTNSGVGAPSTTPEPSDVAYGLDNIGVGAQTPASSIFDTISDVATKGVPLTGLSIVNSFANTAIDVGNWLNGDNTERLSIDKEVPDLEQATGQTGLQDYYNSNKNLIEGAGFAIGSLIPGTLAIKGLKLAQAGEFGTTLARATGIFAARRDAVVAGALSDINEGTGALFPSFTTQKLQAFAYGAGDQAVQALAFQVASVATMKASPLFDKADVQSIGNDMFYGTLLGAGVGGALEGWASRGLINKAIINADMTTKEAENISSLGKLGVLPGDKAATIIDSMYGIPDQSSQLGIAKQAISTDNAKLQVRTLLSGITPDGDESLGGQVADMLFQAKDQSGVDRDGMYKLLGRLTQISRLGDDSAYGPTGDFFYVNKFANGSNPNWNDLVTGEQNAAADVSRKFQLKPFSTEPSIANFTQSIIAPDGSSSPLYQTAEDAWADGHDIFIQKGGKVFVNPSAPNLNEVALDGYSRTLSQAEYKAYNTTGSLPENSRPLYSTPFILNLRSGGLTDSAVQTVGDIGRPELVSSGLKFGNQISQQSVSGALSADTTAINSNARYIWAGQRGVRYGDSIQEGDIPLLEQTYLKAQQSSNFSEYVDNLNKRGVSYADDAIPNNQSTLLSTIKNAKDELLTTLMDAHPGMSSEELAMRANVSQDYIANQFQASKPEDLIVPIQEWEQPSHVQLTYDISRNTQQNGMIVKGLQDVAYRIHLAKAAAQDAAAKYLGPDWANFQANLNSSAANIGGAGNSFLGSSNANYGSLAQEMERIGSLVGPRIQKLTSAHFNTLTTPINTIRNDYAASADWGNFISVRHSTGEKFEFLPPELAQKYNLNPNTAVLSSALKRDRVGNVVDWDESYIPDGWISGQKLNPQGFVGPSVEDPQKALYSYYQLNPKVAAIERAQQAINDDRVESWNNFYATQGLDRRLPLGTLYTPPVDTSKFKFFAYVRSKPGTAMGGDGVGILTAASDQELRDRIASLDPNLSAFTKDNIKEYQKAEGDYQYDKNFASAQVNSELARRGILNNILPDTRPETIIDNYARWNSNQNAALVRSHVELLNAQLFSEVEQMGKRFSGTATSQIGALAPFTSRSADDPYSQYIRTALGIGNKSNYPLWNYAQDKLEAFGDTAFNTLKYAFKSAQSGLVDYDTASQMAKSFGLGAPYENITDSLKAYYNFANRMPDPRILSKIVSAGNLALGNSVIRLDTFQQAIHILSAPAMITLESMTATSALKDMTSTILPDGTGRSIPSIAKGIFRAVNNWFDPAVHAKYGPLYEGIGVNRDELSSYQDAYNAMALPFGSQKAQDASEWISNVIDKAATFSGANFSRNFIHFVTADYARQLFEAAGYQGKELSANIQTFANRVQGNYIASQRPVAFQGPLGQAIGLFQTYQQNLYQQVLRHVENGQGKALAVAAAMNTSIFGLQSLPGFQALNNHIIGNAATNPGHSDFYSTVGGNQLGDYLLYGSLSNILNTGLYQRGDLNPRSSALLPFNPLNYPAISGGIRFMGSLIDASSRIAQGGSVPASMLMAAEHNGLSRPLAGLAQLVQGYATTSNGKLIADTNTRDQTTGTSDLFSIANFSRLLGARPLDEAVALDAAYRSTLYKADDRSKMTSLGSAVRSTLLGGSDVAPDQAALDNFMTEYAASGGDINSFGAHMLNWTQGAKSSVANQVFRTGLASPLSQNMQKVMGGKELPDFTNQGSGRQIGSVFDRYNPMSTSVQTQEQQAPEEDQTP